MELTGDESGDTTKLLWGIGDEERFQGDLDEKVWRNHLLSRLALRRLALRSRGIVAFVSSEETIFLMD